MIDARFFRTAPPRSRADALAAAGLNAGEEAGAGEVVIHRVASVDDDDLQDAAIFCDSSPLWKSVAGRGFALAFVKPGMDGAGDRAVACAHPRAAFARLAAALHRPIDPCEDGEAARIDPDAEIHPSAIIAPGAEIAAGCRIGPLAVIGPGVVLGEGAVIEAQASLFCAIAGPRLRVLPGARIGQEGFGFAPDAAGPVRMPQLGRVRIGADVEIGANATIDRGALGDTVLGDRVKIDNLVQIAHNVRIGPGSVIAAQTGVSGSTTIGAGVMMGGQVGIVDHLSIGDHTRFAAQTGVMRDVPAGQSWGGTPGKPSRRWLRETATLSKLAEKKTDGHG